MSLRSALIPSAAEFRRAWPLWAFMLVCVLIELRGDSLRVLLRYEREAILGGELWRLLTAHVTHLGWPHLWLNLAALFVGWLLCGHCFSMGRWALLVFGGSLAISGLFLPLDPGLQWYVGLSGVLHGLLAAGALAMLRRREPGAWLFIGFLAVKLAWEQFLGPLPFTAEASGGPVVINAHLYGTLSCLALAALLLLDRKSVV